MGIFIQVQVDQTKLTPGIRQILVELCPVDIFALDNDQLGIVADNEDECTLCELCLMKAPAGAITIRKTYRDEMLVSRGSSSNSNST